jgi:hypothetical protein
MEPDLFSRRRQRRVELDGRQPWMELGWRSRGCCGPATPGRVSSVQARVSASFDQVRRGGELGSGGANRPVRPCVEQESGRYSALRWSVEGRRQPSPACAVAHQRGKARA